MRETGNIATRLLRGIYCPSVEKKHGQWFNLEWKFQGGGGCKAKVPCVGGGGGGYGYFLKLHILHHCRLFIV